MPTLAWACCYVPGAPHAHASVGMAPKPLGLSLAGHYRPSPPTAGKRPRSSGPPRRSPPRSSSPRDSIKSDLLAKAWEAASPASQRDLAGTAGAGPDGAGDAGDVQGQQEDLSIQAGKGDVRQVRQTSSGGCECRAPSGQPASGPTSSRPAEGRQPPQFGVLLRSPEFQGRGHADGHGHRFRARTQAVLLMAAEEDRPTWRPPTPWRTNCGGDAHRPARQEASISAAVAAPLQRRGLAHHGN